MDHKPVFRTQHTPQTGAGGQGQNPVGDRRGQLTVDEGLFQAAVNMIKKMKKKLRPRLFMVTAFVTMMIINLFAVKFSTIWLLIIAAVANVMIYTIGSMKKEAK